MLTNGPPLFLSANSLQNFSFGFCFSPHAAPVPVPNMRPIAIPIATLFVATLTAAPKEIPNVKRVNFVETTGTALFQATCDLALEGIMAKDKTSIYIPDQRGPHCLKVERVRESEFVIGSYSFGGARKELFSSLLLGLYDDRGRLKYVASVGTGFSDLESKEIYAELQSRHTETRPFTTQPDLKRFIYWCWPELLD